ncbi:hypothetical protein MMC13_008259 [Lambiella insularis]|nr:hypothetical protein [Lambiella insularis]
MAPYPLPCRPELGPDEAQQVARDYVEGINADLEYLKQQCGLYGNIIMKRWKKKSPEKREACLLLADPSMYPRKWFHIDQKHNLERGKNRRSWLLPYVNLETLKADASRFLALLHIRTHYSPEQWVPFDNEQLVYGWHQWAIKTDCSSRAVTMYGPLYGRLTSWDKDASHRWDIIGFPRARLIFEAQRELARLLRNIVEQLTEGVPNSTSGSSDKWFQSATLGFTGSGNAAAWSTLTNQPFSAPPIFSIDALLSKAEMKYQAAEDHLCCVPSHTQSQMLVIELTHDTSNVFHWQQIVLECKKFKDQCRGFQGSVSPGECLPPEYDRALGVLKILLEKQVDARARRLYAFFPQRPGFSHLFRLEENPDTGKVIMVGCGAITRSKDPLEYCLYHLCHLPDEPGHLDRAMLFAFLDDHLSTGLPAERARFDQNLYDLVSDYAAINEMLIAIHLHRPLSSYRPLDDNTELGKFNPWTCVDYVFGAVIPEPMNSASIEMLQRFQNLLVLKGKVNRTFLEQFDDVYEVLGSFWMKLRGGYQKMLTGLLYPPEAIQSAMEILALDTRPEHIAKVAAEREQIQAKISDATRASGSNSIQTQWGPAVESAKPPAVPKLKVKSRADTANPTTEPEDLPLADLVIERPKILVKKANLDILSKMFPNSAKEANRSINWDEFVHAMRDAGFSAQHTGGSAVSFDKSDGAQEGQNGKTVFHKPHPDAKIDPVMFHSMGKKPRHRGDRKCRGGVAFSRGGKGYVCVGGFMGTEVSLV